MKQHIYGLKIKGGILMHYNFKEVPNDLVDQFKDEFEFGVFECDQSMTIDGLDSSQLFDYGNQICYTYCEEIIGVAEVHISNQFLEKEDVFYFFDEISDDSYELYARAISKQAKHLELVTTQKFAYIEEINIHPQFRGIGLGKHLLLSVETFLETLGIKAIYLISGILENESAAPHKFYEKLDYKLLFMDDDEYKGRGYFKILQTEPTLFNIFRNQRPQLYIEDYFVEIPLNVQEALEYMAEINEYRLVLNKESFLIIAEDSEWDAKIRGLRGLIDILEDFAKSFEDFARDCQELINQSNKSAKQKDVDNIKMLLQYKRILENFVSKLK